MCDPMGVQGGGAVGRSCLDSELLPGPHTQRSTMKNMHNCGLGPKSQQTPCHTKSWLGINDDFLPMTSKEAEMRGRGSWV